MFFTIICRKMPFSGLSLKLREFVFPEELELKSFHVENTVRGCYWTHGEGWSRPKQYLSRELGERARQRGPCFEQNVSLLRYNPSPTESHHLYMQWCCLGNRLYPSMEVGGIAHGYLACVKVKPPPSSREVGSVSFVSLSKCLSVFKITWKQLLR